MQPYKVSAVTEHRVCVCVCVRELECSGRSCAAGPPKQLRTLKINVQRPDVNQTEQKMWISVPNHTLLTCQECVCFFGFFFLKGGKYAVTSGEESGVCFYCRSFCFSPV